ncbi:substrate-binding periplasmic protein [Shewanella frigidimarina]|uniref:substrate-binding periplasmic protein n=1 Tax=Shewanella frigidimarina TaxID=56812 RepID=UPI003F9FF849|tara:strand:+ start:388 stop:1281 length:894 start_codon:yes stop_codon:yes gene_type:complete
MKSSLIWILTIIILCVSYSLKAVDTSVQPKTIVTYNAAIHGIDPKQAYFVSLLELALEKSRDKYGDFQMNAAMIQMPQGRALKMVADNTIIDVVWTMTSIEREDQLQAIYVPLLKGLMGYRIGLIRKNDQAKFDNIHSIEDIKKTLIGQGADWPDVPILNSNGFTVTSGSDSRLIAMLLKGRFDYYPRSIHEPWRDLYRYPDVILEQRILLKYPAPIYFFVSKDNTSLAQRIEFGLRKAIDDGSFDDLFYNHPITQGMLSKSELDNRTEFVLHNPFLSKKSADLLNETQLWLTLKQQ